MPVAYLGQFGTNWYAVISGQGPYGNYPDEMPNHWGNDFTTLEQRLAVFQQGIFQPIQWKDAPPQLTRMNMMESAFFNDFISWNGKRLTLAQKNKFDIAHATPYDLQISRPFTNFEKLQGETK